MTEDKLMDVETVDRDGNDVVVEDVPYIEDNDRLQKLWNTRQLLIKGFEQMGTEFTSRYQYIKAKMIEDEEVTEEDWEYIEDDCYDIELNPDTIFYHIWCSIRGDWSQGIKERGEMLLEILPKTTLKHKEEMKDLIEEMMTHWKHRYEDDVPYFDGRHYARGQRFCFYEMKNYFKEPENLDVRHTESKYLKDRIDPKIPMKHIDAVILYQLWKRGGKDV